MNWIEMNEAKDYNNKGKNGKQFNKNKKKQNDDKGKETIFHVLAIFWNGRSRWWKENWKFLKTRERQFLNKN